MQAGDNECSVCLDDLDPSTGRILRRCRHTFCGECLVELLRDAASCSSSSKRPKAAVARCPLCRKGFAFADILALETIQVPAPQLPPPSVSEPNATAANASQNTSEGSYQRWPPKIEALLEDLQAALKVDPSVKAVVFSQFVGFLNVIQARFTLENLLLSRH